VHADTCGLDRLEGSFLPDGEHGLPRARLADLAGQHPELLRLHDFHADVAPYYRCANLLVLPSVKEGLPNVVLEAMASGLPALLSNKPALCDFQQNVNGISYFTPEVEPIAAAMTKMAEMPDTDRRSLGARQASGVCQHYGLDVGPECYLKVWVEESRKLTRTKNL
jgi:glycosyltransferase involved in cell wall biosynthesis